MRTQAAGYRSNDLTLRVKWQMGTSDAHRIIFGVETAGVSTYGLFPEFFGFEEDDDQADESGQKENNDGKEVAHRL